MQPYGGEDRPEGHGLWYLRELSNLDKHRLSPFVYQVAERGRIFSCPILLTGTSNVIFNSGDIQHGTTVAKVYLTDPASPEMEVTLDLTFGITVRDLEPVDIPKLGVLVALERIYGRVMNAIVVLEPFLA